MKQNRSGMSPWIQLCIIVTIAVFAFIFLFLYNGGFAKAVFGNSNSTSNWTDIDVISSLISGFSIFITIVLFAIGIPIAFISYNTRRESKDDFNEIKSDFKEIKEDYVRNKNDYENIKRDYEKIKEKNVQQHLEIKEQIKPIEDEIKENEAFKKIEKVYKDDPQNIWKGDDLERFSQCFSETHGQDAQKYFLKAKYLMKDKLININHVKNKDGIYKPDDLEDILTAVKYFSMCEVLFFENDRENFSHYDIYREMSNVYKSLGLRFYNHNKVITLDYLLKALEYCQKAIYEDDSYMLTYNNKSNILKDIFRLYNDEENDKDTKNLLVKDLKNKIKSVGLNIFDFKNIEGGRQLFCRQFAKLPSLTSLISRFSTT